METLFSLKYKNKNITATYSSKNLSFNYYPDGNGMDILNLKFRYENEDYDCPILDLRYVVQLVKSNLIPENSILYSQLNELIVNSINLRLVY